MLTLPGSRLSISRLRRSFVHYLPPLNFITLHYAYFIGTCMLCSVIFWGSSTPAKSVTYTDSLFLVVSAMTLAGLNTINLSTINTFQQFLLFLLIMLGSAIWVSIAVVHVRRKAFERRFKSIAEQARARKRERDKLRRRLTFSRSRNRSSSRPEVDGIVVRGSVIKSEDLPVGPIKGHEEETLNDEHSSEARGRQLMQERHEESSSEIGEAESHKHLNIDTGVTRRVTFASPSSATRSRDHSRLLAMQGVGARQNLYNHPLKAGKPVYTADLPRLDENVVDELSFEPQSRVLSNILVGRNSQFSNLSLRQRERLGGVEYRAVSFLAVVVPLYFFLWQFLGCIGLGAYVAHNRPDTARVNGENPW